jgi:hypothetical protein
VIWVGKWIETARAALANCPFSRQPITSDWHWGVVML